MVSVPVGSSGTPKHTYVSVVTSAACAYQAEPGGFYCALPQSDSVHTSAPAIITTLQEMFVPYQRYQQQVELRFPDPPTVQGVAAYFEECTDLVRIKNPEYGEAWRAQGYMGNLSRVLSKAARLKAMLWRDEGDDPPDKPTESIQDTLRDLANLTAFMHQNFEDGNRWGV